MGLPSHRRIAQGVWDALYLTLVYWRQAGDDFLVRGRSANSRLVHGGRAEKGIGAVTVVVGAEDVPGQQRCRRSW